MSKKVNICLNNEKIVSDALLADSFYTRLFGLMFKKKPKELFVIFFKDCFWIHSLFCFFRFDAIFLDDNLRVVAYKSNIPPFLILKPVFGAKYVIEIVNGCFDIKIGDKITIDEN